MTSAARVEANRKNVQRSTGPRTEEGKDRSRFNALKDAASARSPVIPGEDAAEFRHRIDTWTASLSPTNEIECYLVEHAARASLQLHRIDRAYATNSRALLRSLDLLRKLRQPPAAATPPTPVTPHQIEPNLASQPTEIFQSNTRKRLRSTNHQGARPGVPMPSKSHENEELRILKKAHDRFPGDSEDKSTWVPWDRTRTRAREPKSTKRLSPADRTRSGLREPTA